MRYTEEFTKKVLSSVNIKDVIGKYTALKQNGTVFVGECPFQKSRPSTLVVFPDKNVFHCFDCGKNGNAIIFLMELKHISMSEAIDELAKNIGIKSTQNDIVKENNAVLKKNLYDIYKDAAIFYVNKLKEPEGESALKYLKDRQLSDKTIGSFGLGYSPAKGNSLYKFLCAKGYTNELMLASGLIKKSENGYYDMFRGRVMFPIINENKNVIAFSGRVLDDETKPKYLNSAESPIFNKSNTLFGIRQVEKRRHNYLILCEGQMDVIALHQSGFKNAVATLGTAFTLSHIPVIKEYTNNLILSFDCDAAGQKAALRTIRAVEDKGLNVSVLSMSPAKDPDEFIKTYGKQAYQTRIDTCLDKDTFLLKQLASQYDLSDGSQKKEFLDRAVRTIFSKNPNVFSFDDLEPVLDSR